MASKRVTGRQKPPDREQVLRETWLRVIKLLGPDGLLIGGKSMGGRIASLVADEAGIVGLVCLGYPFHPVGKAEQLRVEHLRTIRTPTLIVQGERDPFGNREEVQKYKLSPAIRVAWIDDGEHSFKPRKASGRTCRTGTKPWMRSRGSWLPSNHRMNDVSILPPIATRPLP